MFKQICSVLTWTPRPWINMLTLQDLMGKAFVHYLQTGQFSWHDAKQTWNSSDKRDGGWNWYWYCAGHSKVVRLNELVRWKGLIRPKETKPNISTCPKHHSQHYLLLLTQHLFRNWALIFIVWAPASQTRTSELLPGLTTVRTTGLRRWGTRKRVECAPYTLVKRDIAQKQCQAPTTWFLEPHATLFQLRGLRGSQVGMSNNMFYTNTRLLMCLPCWMHIVLQQRQWSKALGLIFLLAQKMMKLRCPGQIPWKQEIK